jgi:hypothetical protein
VTVIEYATEEVRRQGHDIYTLDGVERVGWMLNAWSHAWDTLTPETLSLRQIVALGKMVEPHKNRSGLRSVGVRVGLRVCPRPDEVEGLLERWCELRPSMQPLEAYKEFEEIHPFVDGNGRTGKIILNLLNRTLDDPIFPPADLWGRAIQNP